MSGEPTPGPGGGRAEICVHRRLVIAGHAPEALGLLPALEANPLVQVTAIVTDDLQAARERLCAVDLTLAQRFADRITTDADAALSARGLAAVIDGNAPPRVRERLHTLRGLQVLTPGLARTLFAFGPVDAFSKPDLLQILREILLSAELTRDQRTVLDLVLQGAVAATGAARGSLLLWDERDGVLRVAASLGIEEELLGKIRVAPGEGIAGRAFSERRALLVRGKADRHQWQILRERDDVESAISVPLLHEGRALGVLNLSHARSERQFDEEDLRFVEELARLDARILARAEEFERLLRESRQHRLEAELRRCLSRAGPLGERLEGACAILAQSLGTELAELWLLAPDASEASLCASSARPGCSPGRPGPGLARTAVAERRAVWLAGSGPDAAVRFAGLPLGDAAFLLGVLLLHGQSAAGEESAEERWTDAAALLTDCLRDALAADRARLASQRDVRLAEAMAAFASCRSPRALQDLLTSSALALLGAQDAVLRIREDGSTRLPVVAWSGSGAWRRGPLAETERKLSEEAVRSRTPLRSFAADAAGAPAGALRTPVMAMALLRGGSVIGSLCVIGRLPQVRGLAEGFDNVDEEALSRLTRHAVSALAALAAPQAAPGPRAQAALPDRSQLRERLVAELARARVRGHRLLLLEIEIPRLAAVGGETPPVAEALRDALREFDLVARVGPSRFAALVPEPDEETTALLTRLYRALRDALGEGLAPTPEPLLRIGYALFPDDGGDADALEARAALPRVEGS